MNPLRILSSVAPRGLLLACLTAPAVAQSTPLLLENLRTFQVAQVEPPVGLPDFFSTTVIVDGEVLKLELERVSVWAPDAVIEIHRDGGEIEVVEAPEANTYRGRVVDQPGSLVAAALMSDGFHASISSPDQELRVIEPAGEQTGLHVMYRPSSIAAAPISCQQPPASSSPAHSHTSTPQTQSPLPAQPTPVSTLGGGLYLAELGLDTDFEYCLNFSLSTLDITFELAKVIHTANTLAFASGQIQHILTTAILRVSPADPYSSTDGLTINNEQATEWLANQSETPYDLVLLFTGKDSCTTTATGCGLAGRAKDLGVVCDRDNAFCFAEYFTDDITQYQVVAHELGHLWNGRHCNTDSQSMCIGVGPCQLMCATLNSCDNSFPNQIGFAACNLGRVVDHRNSRTCLDTTTDLRWVWWLPIPDLGNGNLGTPHTQLRNAVNAILPGGTIVIFEGSSALNPLEFLPLVIDKEVTLRCFGDAAVINQ